MGPKGRFVALAERVVARKWTEQAREDLPSLLRKVVAMYNSAEGEDILGRPVNGQRHSEWIAELGHDRLEHLASTVRVVIPSYLDSQAGRAAVFTQAVLRHPIHMPAPHPVRPGALKATLGYDEQDALDLEMSGIVEAPLRFAIVGKARAKYPRVVDEGNGRRFRLDHLWLIHAWGVHLGDGGARAPYPPADQRYVTAGHGPAARVQRYKELADVNAALIKRAVKHVIASSQGRRALLMWNGLGMGVWLDPSALGGRTEANAVRQYWTDKAKETAGELNRELQDDRAVLVWQPFYSPERAEQRTDAYFSPTETLRGVTRNADPCGGFISGAAASSPEEHIADPADAIFYPGGRVPIIVNAWDDWSFVGNGGARDNTLDGWVVAGGTGASGSRIKPRDPTVTPSGVCWQAASTAYMHNVFFSPAALGSMIVAKTPGQSKTFQTLTKTMLQRFTTA